MTDLGNSLDDDTRERELKRIKQISQNENFRVKKDSERIIELAEEKCTLFKDQYNQGYALVKIEGHYESMLLSNKKFNLYLTNLFYLNNFKIPTNKENINNATQILEAKAAFGPSKYLLHIRVAIDKDSIYYDLTDDHWNCVKIDRSGWQITKPNLPLFRRYNQTAQPIPDSNYDSNIMDKFIGLTNLKNNDDILLTKVWIISTFIPDIAHAIFNVHGGQGAAKTTFQKLVKQLVDPDKPENLLSISHDKMEFIQQISHKHVVLYDNLRYKVDWLSEEVCKAVTGGGTTKRKLYSDEDDIIFDFKVCIGFNGINMILNEPDVLRRSIIIQLETIEDSDKISESRIFSTAEELRPKLLGYIFDIVSKAISIKDSVDLTETPGMADFAIWGEAISRAMGYQEMQFVDVYRRNINRQNEYVIDTNPFAKAIFLLYNDLQTESNIQAKFVWNNELETWSIAATQFIEELKGSAIRAGVDINDKRFPSVTNRLVNSLNTIRSNLRSCGIDVIIRESRTKQDRDNGFNRNITIVDIKTARPTPHSSLPPYYSESGYPIRPNLCNGGNDCNDKVIPFVGNEEKMEESNETIVTIPTIATKSELASCLKCGYQATSYWIKIHENNCEG